MSVKLNAGTKIEFHSNHDYETNCAVCARPLGDNASELLLADGNVLVTAAEYDALAENGGFVFTATIGNSCLKKFASDVIA